MLVVRWKEVIENRVHLLELIVSPGFKLTECQVEPAVSSDFSSRTTSFIPPFAKWYAILVPKAPPPITTTSASSFSRLLSGIWLQQNRRGEIKIRMTLCHTVRTSAISWIRTRIFLTNCLKVTYFSRFRDVRIPGDVREKSKIKATFLQNLEASVPSEPFPH